MAKVMGEVIRSLRKARGYTQEELAELLSVSGQTVSKWENHISLPDLSMIVPISRFFGVDTDVLFDVSGRSEDDEVREILEQGEALVYDEKGLPRPGEGCIRPI